MNAVARYLLSVYGPAEPTTFGTYPSREEMLEAFADTGAFNDRLQSEGRLVFADGLEQASTATTVDGRGERPTFTDGPYLETKEHLGASGSSRPLTSMRPWRWPPKGPRRVAGRSRCALSRPPSPSVP